MFMKNYFQLILIMALAVASCKSKEKLQLPVASDVLHNNERNLTDLIINDIFTPPVAARIYVYTSLAAYEAIRYSNPKEESIVLKLNGFPEMPKPDQSKKYNYTLAASKAFYSVADKLTFSKDILAKYEAATYTPYKQVLCDEEYSNSISFGEAIAKKIMDRLATDNYKKTRALEKFYGSKEDGKWQPTAPDYLDGVEPYWTQIRPLVMDSANQFNPGPPPVFNKNKESEFYKMNKEVFDMGVNITQEQKEIAHFWDDNPFVVEHTGHMMMALKKQTPGGHWMGIATIACRQTKADALKSAKTYALTSIALFEGFVSVFDTKYRYSYVRPITIINQWMDAKWEPLLQTPPFPEYTSGHSTITGSAATVLTNLYGENFAFQDTSDMRYINMQRYFKSFLMASDECSVSRLYGGIHYRVSLNRGADCGKKIGALIINKLLK